MNASAVTLRLPPDYALRALPVPAGWYVALPSADLPAAGVRRVALCGREVALWRTASGRACAADNVCGHLGARLAPRARVRGELLECSQHHHRFDHQGAAASAGAACLSTLPVREHGGTVLVWHHPAGGPPTWEVPAADDAGWTVPVFRTLEVETHPQHVMQDLADLSHFETIHRYGQVRATKSLQTVGPKLSLSVSFGWDTGVRGAPKLPASFHSEAWGLGYQRTEVLLPLGQIRSRHLVLPTPIDATRVRLHLGVSIRTLDRLGRAEAIAGPLFAPVRRALRRFMLAMFERDVGRDASLWRELYALEGVLPAPDETIAQYRTWASQFYA